MTLHLDGKFWAPYIRQRFIADIEWMRRSAFEHMLPSFPNPNTEGDRVQKEAWEVGIATYSDGYGDSSDTADWAFEQGLDAYEGVTKMRQAAASMTTVLLWHLLEQQILCFHMRQVVKIQEQQQARLDQKLHRAIFQLEDFKKRLRDGNCPIETFNSWPKLDELRLAANVIKHGPGASLDALYKIRSDLFNHPQADPSLFPIGGRSSWVEIPASGEDIYITDADLANYFDASRNFWLEFSEAIERHTLDKK